MKPLWEKRERRQRETERKRGKAPIIRLFTMPYNDMCVEYFMQHISFEHAPMHHVCTPIKPDLRVVQPAAKVWFWTTSDSVFTLITNTQLARLSRSWHMARPVCRGRQQLSTVTSSSQQDEGQWLPLVNRMKGSDFLLSTGWRTVTSSYQQDEGQLIKTSCCQFLLDVKICGQNIEIIYLIAAVS